MPIQYLVGDATRPQGAGPKLLIHVCNDQGGWGEPKGTRSFVQAISRRWPAPEQAYRRWYADEDREAQFGLGNIQVVPVTKDLSVINMVAQSGYRHTPAVTTPLRLGALIACLHRVAKVARTQQASIHMPRIGTGLAGGKWEDIEPLLQEQFTDLDVYVYDLPG